MRSPSSRIINQSCIIYPATRTQDSTGGPKYTYALPFGRGFRCSAQPHEFEEVYENDRVTQYRHWRLMFTTDPLIQLRDKLVWTDAAGVTHTGFAEVSRGEAGRDAAWTVRVVEKL